MSRSIERTDWGREASLLRPAKLTLTLFEETPGPDPSRPWIPEKLLPLFGGAAFGRLTPGQRLRYNHAYARQLVDEFIWTERVLILGPLKRLGRSKSLDPDKSAVLHSFISDEINHVESFSRLEELAAAADPALSKSTFQPPRVIRILAGLAARFPRRLNFWAPVIEAFEKRTLDIGSDYHRDQDVDPLFRECFVSHARDEARHCRLDDLIAKWLQSEAGARWNALSKRLASTFHETYRSVEWGLDGPVRDLVRSHPEIAPEADALIAESKLLRRAAARARTGPG